MIIFCIPEENKIRIKEETAKKAAYPKVYSGSNGKYRNDEGINNITVAGTKISLNLSFRFTNPTRNEQMNTTAIFANMIPISSPGEAASCV